MSNNFNFIQTTLSGLDFNFGDTGSSPYYDFNFEDSKYKYSYDFHFGKSINFYYVLKGNSNYLTSIWVLNNKMYVSSSGVLTVVDINNHSIDDYYSSDHYGKANEELEYNDIKDMNVI